MQVFDACLYTLVEQVALGWGIPRRLFGDTVDLRAWRGFCFVGNSASLGCTISKHLRHRSVSEQVSPDHIADLFPLAATGQPEGTPPMPIAKQADRLRRLLDDGSCGTWEWRPGKEQAAAAGAIWRIFDEDPRQALEGLWSGSALVLVHPDDREKVRAQRQRMESGDCTLDMVFRAHDGVGQQHWLHFWGRGYSSSSLAEEVLSQESPADALSSAPATYFAGACVDITEALSVRYLSVLRGEQPLQALAGVGDGLWEWDLRADEVVLDGACWAILGYDKSQLDCDARSALALWKRRMLPEDYHRADQALRDHVREQLPLDVEFRLWHRDGGIVWVRCRGQVQCNADSKPVRVIGILQDVTGTREALQRAERELQRQREESSNAAELMMSLGHELRTPLNAILGYSKMVELDQSLNPDQRNRLSEIRRAGQHLLHLVGDVLELARIDSERLAPSMEPMQPAALVADCKRLLEPLAETRKVSLIFEPLGWESAYVCADPVRFKQVVLNLAGNAVKYNRENGRVVINFAPQPGGWLRLSFLDTGCGIPEAKRAEVFEPFNRLGAEKSHIEGTGVGLAIAKRLTEAMGGRIDFDSHEDQGSIFWIEFPLIDAPAEIMQLPAQPDSMQMPPACRLLQVEARPAEIKRVRSLLTGFSHVEHLVVADAVEAIFTARTQEPDVILLDAAMPGMSADELARILKSDATTADISCIAVGDYSGEACVAALPAGFQLVQLCNLLEACVSPRE